MFYLKLPQPRQVWATNIPPKCLPIWHRVSVNPGGGQRLEACHHHQTGLATDLFIFFNLVNPGGAKCTVTYHQTRPFGNKTVFQYFFARDPDKYFKSWLWCFVKKRSSCPLTKTTFTLVFRSSWASRSCWTSQTSKTQHKQRLTQSTGGCSRSGLPSWFLVVDPPHTRARTAATTPSFLLLWCTTHLKYFITDSAHSCTSSRIASENLSLSFACFSQNRMDYEKRVRTQAKKFAPT